MKTHKVTSCLYTDKKGKKQRGIFILDRKTNTFTVLDKRLNKVHNIDNGLITLPDAEGCIYFDLNRH